MFDLFGRADDRLQTLARTASMAAFSASRLVCSLMSWITLTLTVTTLPISSERAGELGRTYPIAGRIDPTSSISQET
jgi:hypothetical protein